MSVAPSAAAAAVSLAASAVAVSSAPSAAAAPPVAAAGAALSDGCASAAGAAAGGGLSFGASFCRCALICIARVELELERCVSWYTARPQCRADVAWAAQTLRKCSIPAR